jgi:hypothetical protein
VSNPMSNAAIRIDETPAPGSAPAQRRIPLALLDGYKVRWNRVTVARDIVQNFFDEVDDFDEVVIEVDAALRVIEVRGPSRFDLEYLRYIGATSKANRRTAGGFGEGFKVCALVLVRDFHCAVTAGSGAWEIRPVLQPMKLGCELCYDVRTRPPGEEHPGSFVRIEGADARLCEAFAGAKELFRHPKNPRLQAPIYVDEKAGIGVFVPPEGRTGDLFYRRQRRGALRFGLGGALTFAFDDRLDGIEVDRDRRDLAAAWPMITTIAARLPDEVIGRLVLHLRAYWHRGGKVLGALLAEAARRGLRLSFPRRWLARVKHGYFLERRAERLGFHLGVRALAAVGMPTVEDRFASAQAPRPPTAVEAARVAVTRDLYTLLAREEPLFSRLRVVDMEPPGHDFRGKSCVMPAVSLSASFGEGIAPCLARLACAAGPRSRRNADRLTALLEGAMLRAGTLAPFEERWDAAAVDPSREGADPAEYADDAGPEDDWRLTRVAFAVLAPEGFPPAEALRARIAKLCAAEGVVAFSIETPVNRIRDALLSYARGVPSVWIGGTEIEPEKGTRPAFDVRTFSAEGGGRALLPTDEALLAAIRSEAGRSRGHRMATLVRMNKRKKQGIAALERWLSLHAPDEHRRILEARSIALVSDYAQEQKPLPYPAHALAVAIAKRDLPEIHAQYDDGELDASADEAYEVAADQVGDLLGAMIAQAPGLLSSGPRMEGALQCLCQRAQKAIEGGATDEAAFAEVVAAAAFVVEIWGWLDVVPLDAACGRTCMNEALTRLWEVPPGEAQARARERFDDAVGYAAGRHGEVDADGNPVSCYTLFQALGERYGRPTLAPPRSPEVANAVRAAWGEATAAGLDEVEAARRCLGVAAAAVEPR